MFVGEIFYTGLVRGARRRLASTGDEQVGVLVIDNVRLCFTDLARSVEFSHTARFGVIVENDRAVTSTRSSVSLYGSSASLERLAARAMEARQLQPGPRRASSHAAEAQQSGEIGERRMLSPQASALWDAFESGPKQVDLPLLARREAGEHGEDPTSEPTGVSVVDVPELQGIAAAPDSGASGTTILWLFGGGYVLGSPATRRKTAGHLASATGARVVVPSYRLAPEHPFPAAVDDAYAAYQWILDHGTEPGRLIVAGDSAGGGLAVATLLAVRDHGVAMAAGCVVLSPWADLRCAGATMRTRADVDIMCTRDSLLEMASWYLDGHDPADPLASPVLGDMTGLPPLLALAGSAEVLMDDAQRLVYAVSEAGSDATLFVGSGMQHVWPVWKGAFPEADAAIAMIGGWILAHTSQPTTSAKAEAH